MSPYRRRATQAEPDAAPKRPSAWLFAVADALPALAFCVPWGAATLWSLACSPAHADQLRKGLDAYAQIAPVVVPCVAAAAQADVLACDGEPTCEREAQDRAEVSASALDTLRAWWCAFAGRDCPPEETPAP